MKPLFLALISFVVSTASVAQTYTDNMPTGTGIVTPGLPPSASTEGDSEKVDLSTGSLNMFIPALTLRQRQGAAPLVLGFTYDSNQFELRQDISTQILTSPPYGPDQDPSPVGCFAYECPDLLGLQPLLAYLPGNNVVGLQQSTGGYLYDGYTYSENVTPTGPPTGMPLQVNLPLLRASIEYFGDAYNLPNPAWGAGGGNVGDGTYNVIPIFCVTNFAFTDWSGSTHSFSVPYPVVSECNSEVIDYNHSGANYILPTEEASDGSLYRLDTSNLSDITVTSADGTVYHFIDNLYGSGNISNQRFQFSNLMGDNFNMFSSGSSDPNGLLDVASSIVDKNGNTITISNGTGMYYGQQGVITDTLGRAIHVQAMGTTLSSGQTVAVPIGFYYTDSTGSPQSVLFAKSGFQQTSTPDIGPNTTWRIGCSAPGDAPPLAQYQVVTPYFNAANIPNGGINSYLLTFSGTQKQMSLQFDSFNRLNNIVYPGGGYSRYDYQENDFNVPYDSSHPGPVGCSWGSAMVFHRYQCAAPSGSCGTEDKTTYNYQIFIGPLSAGTTVTDPIGQTSVHVFSDFIPANLDIDTQTYDRSGAQAKDVIRIYNAPSTDYFPYPSEVRTTIGTGSGAVTTIEKYQYDSMQEQIIGMNPSTGTLTHIICVSPCQNGYYPYAIANPVLAQTWDYDGTTLLRSSSAIWQHNAAKHIYDMPLSSTITDPVSGNVAVTSFATDNLGNVQSKTMSGTNATTQSMTYTPLDAYGRPTQAQDAVPGHGPATYSYSDNWIDPNSECVPSVNSNAYLTRVTNALNQATSYKYYSCTGELASVTDPNNQTTQYTYDAIGRVKSIAYPDGGSVHNSFNDSPPNSVQTTKAQSSNANIVTNVVEDGLSRTSQTQLLTDPYGADYADTTYDSIGRIASASNLYRLSSDSTYGITHYYYDALDRRTQQIQPDGSTLWWCYSGIQDVLHPQPNCRSNVSSFTPAQWVDSSDEVGADWQHVSDSLGRLRSVVEPYSLETQYTYDAFGDLLAVDQKGTTGEVPRIRAFQYTGLSQLLQSYNPETGWICYGTTPGNAASSGSNCAEGYDANGNLLSKTDARGVATNYTYDALNRLTNKTYSGSDPSVSITAASCYQYDAANNSSVPNAIGRLVYEWTQPSSCPASTGTPNPIPSSALNWKFITSYDAMGRVQTEEQCPLAPCSTPNSLAYVYDFAGNRIGATNGIPAPANGIPSIASPGILAASGFDAAGRLSTLSTNWNDTTHPGTLFEADQNTQSLTGTAPYGPLGLQSAQLGVSSQSPQQTSMLMSRSYDNRARITGINVLGNQASPITLTISPSEVPSGVSAMATSVCGAACGAGGLMMFVDNSSVASGGYSPGVSSSYFVGSSLSLGTHSLYVVYGGDSTHPSVTSNVVSFAVIANTLPTTTLAAQVTPSPVPAGESGEVDFTLTCNPSCSSPPFGEGYFLVDGNFGGGLTFDETGTASNQTSANLSVGSHTLTAYYYGNGQYAAANYSGTFTVTQQGLPQLNMTVTVTPSPIPGGEYGEVDISSNCTGACGAGHLFVDGNYAGGFYLDSTGADTVYLPPYDPLMTVGAHTLTLQYFGNASFAPTNSDPVSFNIIANTLPVPSVTASVTPYAISSGQPSIVNISVGCNSSCAPSTPNFASGYVFFDGNYGGAFFLSNNGTTTVGVPGSLTAGTHTVVVDFFGNTSYAPANSTPVTFTLTP